MTKWFLSVVGVVTSSFVLAQPADSVNHSATETVTKNAPASESHSVTVVEIEELRKTTKHGLPAGLKVTLDVSGYDDVDQVKSVECSLTAATDDTGKNLIKAEKGFFDRTEFRPNENSGSLEIQVKLKNPARKAAFIKLEGTLDIFVPADDPEATIKISNAKKTAGTPVKSEVLKAANASVVLRLPKKPNEEASGTDTEANEANVDVKDEPLEATLGEGVEQAFSGMFSIGGGPNSITLEIVDPEEKIKGIEFFSSKGKKIKPNGASSTGDETAKLIKTFDFEAPLPETAEMRIYVVTPKSERKIPFSLSNVTLP